MQVIGISATDGAVEAVSARSTRPEVVEWAARVLRRHLRRDRTLLVAVTDARQLRAAIEADGPSPEARERILKAFSDKEPFYVPAKDKVAAFMVKAADTMDWIESLRTDDRRIRRINRMAWTDAEALSEAWHASLARARAASGNIMSGAKRIADLGGGTFAAELTTKGSLTAEGNAMGHCVGGYWNRVAEGSTRIVSIRDADGRPHVTIEMSKAPTIVFEDGSTMLGSHRPKNGVDHVLPALDEWVAVQVRGKQNKVPNQRWMERTNEWFDAARVTWVEFGQTRRTVEGAAPVRVFTSVGRHFASATAAAQDGCGRFRTFVRESRSTVAAAYLVSGLKDIHNHVEDIAVRARFLDVNAGLMMEEFSRRSAAGTIAKALVTSGLLSITKNLRLDECGDGFSRRIFDAVIAHDAPSGHVSQHVLAAVPGGKDVRAVVHRLPLLPLFLLSSGYGGGSEERAVGLVRPHLEAALRSMAADPSAVHGIKAAVGSVSEADIRKGFIFCGLGAEFATVSDRVSSAMQNGVSLARVAVRKARGDVRHGHEALNVSTNMLADGYEARLATAVSTIMKGEGLVICPPPKQAYQPPRSMRAEPLVKQYRYPG